MSSENLITVSIIHSESDIRASRQIREEVFIIEQNVPPEIEYDEYEELSTHIIATINGKPAGTARWRKTEHGQKLERFAVLESARRMGIGAALVQFILDQIGADEVAYLNSQVVAIKFYASLGFKETGRIFYEADIPHRKMIREI